jgi:hypothetical protein
MATTQGKAGKPARGGPKPEALGPQTLYGGRAVGELVREADPDGNVTVHVRRRDTYAHERLRAQGTIPAALMEAGETFRVAMERGQLAGRMPAVDLFKSARNTGSLDDDVVFFARDRVHKALGALGYEPGRGRMPLSAEAVWHMVGCGATPEDFCIRCRGLGWRMSEQKAIGLLIGALERLALHYHLLEPRDIADGARDRGYRDAMRTVVAMARMESNRLRVDGDRKGGRALKAFADEIAQRFRIREDTPT